MGSAQALLTFGFIVPIPSRSGFNYLEGRHHLLFAKHCLYFIILDSLGHISERAEFRVTQLPQCPKKPLCVVQTVKTPAPLHHPQASKTSLGLETRQQSCGPFRKSVI